MPPPVWDFAPKRGNGNFEPGFDRRRPSETPNWSPAPGFSFPKVTESGGAMLASSDVGRAGMGDFFSYPQGSSPQDFMAQQPAIYPEAMEESQISAHAGSMTWESTPAPWDKPAAGPAGISPGAAPAAISELHANRAAAGDAKAAEAVAAAKIAADNAVRAAAAGAPVIAATNAATAQAAANVAAGVAVTHIAQRHAALAQSEATKAVAAANVAAANANAASAPKKGLGDWFELSGMGGMGASHPLDVPLFMGVHARHLLAAGAFLGGLWWLKNRKVK